MNKTYSVKYIFHISYVQSLFTVILKDCEIINLHVIGNTLPWIGEVQIFLKLQHPPPSPTIGNPRAFDCWLCSGRGEYKPCLGVRQNFPLLYLVYNIMQTSDENKEKYQLWDYYLICYQILQTNIVRIKLLKTPKKKF